MLLDMDTYVQNPYPTTVSIDELLTGLGLLYIGCDPHNRGD